MILAFPGLGPIVSALFAALFGFDVVNRGTEAITGEDIWQKLGFKADKKQIAKAKKNKKEIDRKQLFAEIRQDEIDELTPRRGSVADDPVGLARDRAELDLLFSEILPFTARTGRSLKDVVGEQGGTALRALLSDDDRDEVDKSALDAVLPDLSQMSREEILGIAKPPAPAPSPAPAPAPDQNLAALGGAGGL